MNGYIIKATYLTGPHIGKSYFLTKGGYVTDQPDTQWSYACYKTASICRAVCKKLSSNNTVEHRLENKQRERQIEKARAFQFR